MKTFDFTSVNGVTWRAIYADPSECPQSESRQEHEGRVSFYDTRYKHTPHGQFAADYYDSTLLARTERRGLNVHGGIKAWTIDEDTFVQVLTWLRGVSEWWQHHGTPRVTPPSGDFVSGLYGEVYAFVITEDRAGSASKRLLAGYALVKRAPRDDIPADRAFSTHSIWSHDYGQTWFASHGNYLLSREDGLADFTIRAHLNLPVKV